MAFEKYINPFESFGKLFSVGVIEINFQATNYFR